MADSSATNFTFGRKVEVNCVDGIKRAGFLYTKDPVTNAIVLVEYSKINMDEFKTKEEVSEFQDIALHFEIIMGDAYISIADVHTHNDSNSWTHIEEIINRKLHKKSSAEQLDQSNLKCRLEFVAEFIKSHHLPVKIENTAIVLFDGVAKILPPYDATSCVSRNPIVLDKIQKLMAQCNLE